MATLTKCPTCKQAVSSAAATCPHCGELLHVSKSETAINMKDPVHFIGVLLAAIVVIGIIILTIWRVWAYMHGS